VIGKKKVKKKRISGDAYNKNKPAIYIYGAEIKIESREHCALEPTQGKLIWLIN